MSSLFFFFARAMFADLYMTRQVLDQVASVAYTKCRIELGMEVRDCSVTVAEPKMYRGE